MKKHYITFFVLMIVMHVNAAVWTVNNQSGLSADFVELQPALDAAQDGDTIHVQPSSLGYGNINLSKRLVVLGGGHNPEYSPYNSALGSVTFQNGSSGSILKGLNIWFLASPTNGISNNNLISGCWIWAQNPVAFGGNNTHDSWTFEGNIIISQTNSINLGSAGANWIFRNNILHTFSGDWIVSNSPGGCVYDHNLFLCTDVGGFSGALHNSANNVLRNNIFYSTAGTVGAVQTTCSGCTLENNISYDPNAVFSDMPGTGNINNSDPMFTSIPASIWFSYENNYRLQDASPGNNEATDGTDIGIYGGLFQFSEYGFDAGTPRIGDFTILSPAAPQGGTVTIHLRAFGSGQ